MANPIIIGNATPTRAICLTMKIEADTRDDLVSALMNFATQIDREEITTGVSGGYDSGYIYELLVDPTQTHEAYFQQLHAYLKEKDNAKNSAKIPNNA